jgi:exonuclease SbcD
MPLHILHTADWHLGQLFHGYDRDFEHSQFIRWLLGKLTEKHPDVFVLSGDVFDTVNPSAVAQRRFFEFLAAAHAVLPNLQIVITAGNHDAGARIEAPAALLESLKITVVGTVPKDCEGNLLPERLIKPLVDAQGAVAALLVVMPFLRSTDLPQVAEDKDAYLDGIKELYRMALEQARRLRETQYPQAALLALGHCHFSGGEESRDSERRIIIGGSESLRADTFSSDFAYVALGHLHKPQEFEGGRICYSGSPLPLSFAEQNYKHRVLLVSLDKDRLVSSESLLIPKSASLMRIPTQGAAPLAEILRQIEGFLVDPELPPEQQPFLEVQVLDDGPDPTRRKRIETALEGKALRLASIKLCPMPRPQADTVTAKPAILLGDLEALDPMALFKDAYRERYEMDAGEILLSALREILTEEQTKDSHS